MCCWILFARILLRIFASMFISDVRCLVMPSCPHLCDSMDCSPPRYTLSIGSSGKKTGVGCHVLLQGILPTLVPIPGLPHCRQILYCLKYQGSPCILEWVADPFSRKSSQLGSWTEVYCIAGGSLPADLSWKPIHQWYYPVIFFFGDVFFWFSYQCYDGLIEWVCKSSFLWKILRVSEGLASTFL